MKNASFEWLSDQTRLKVSELIFSGVNSEEKTRRNHFRKHLTLRIRWPTDTRVSYHRYFSIGRVELWLC